MTEQRPGSSGPSLALVLLHRGQQKGGGRADLASSQTLDRLPHLACTLSKLGLAQPRSFPAIQELAPGLVRGPHLIVDGLREGERKAVRKG